MLVSRAGVKGVMYEEITETPILNVIMTDDKKKKKSPFSESV